MIFKSIPLLLTMLLGVFTSSSMKVAKAAESDTGYSSTDVRYGGFINFGNSIQWHNNDALEKTEDVLPFASSTAFFQDVQILGREVFNQEAINTLTVNNADHYLDSIWYGKSNLNYYSGEYDHQISFSYNCSLFSLLTSISYSLNESFKIPALVLDGEIFAYFHVTNSGVKLLTLDNYVVSVTQSYRDTSYYVGSEKRYSLDNDISFMLKSGSFRRIKEVSVLSYGSFDTEQDSVYIYEYKNGYKVCGLTSYLSPRSSHNFNYWNVNHYFLPYEITYFDLDGGDLGLGHSIYGERYGVSLQHQYLAQFSFILGGNVDNMQTFQMMTYNDSVFYNRTDVTEEGKAPALANKYLRLGRGRKSDELVAGEGSLVYAYHTPYVNHGITHTTTISIVSMWFYESTSESFMPNHIPSDITSNDYIKYDSLLLGSKDGIHFKYYADKVQGKTYFDMYELNISNQATVAYHGNWWSYVFSGLALGFVGIGTYYLYNTLSTWESSQNFNIQRFYFNLYGNDNQVLPNISKIEFKYQEGHREVIKEEKPDGTLSVGYYKDLPIKVMRIEAGESSSVTETQFWSSKETQIDAFIDISESPERLGDIDYCYYYQNVYETQNFSDFICYYSLLSCWYTTYEGQTERLTTDPNGYYLTTDENGDYIVASIEHPEGVDVNVEDFLEAETTGSIHNYEDGEHSDWHVNPPSFFSFINSDLGKIIAGILSSVGLILFGIICIWLILKLITFISNVSISAFLRRMSKSKKRKRKR